MFSYARRSGLVGETNHLRTTFVTLSIPAQKNSSKTLKILDNPATSDSLSPDPEVGRPRDVGRSGKPTAGREPERKERGTCTLVPSLCGHLPSPSYYRHRLASPGLTFGAHTLVNGDGLLGRRSNSKFA